MNELFNRIIAWRQNNLPAGLPYEPLPQIGFLNKELNEAIDEFIAGNIDKAVGEITDIMIYSLAECINCIESLDYSPELALLETVKKIESRRGAWNPETGKWEKEKNQADVYVPDYFKAKIKKDGDR